MSTLIYLPQRSTKPCEIVAMKVFFKNKHEAKRELQRLLNVVLRTRKLEMKNGASQLVLHVP